MRVPQTIYYLELVPLSEFITAKKPMFKVQLRQVKIPCPAYNRFFYETIGVDWYWTDRRQWSNEDWQKYVNRACLETWVAYTGGNPAGYYEIEKQAEHTVEIVQLGVMPQFTRKGLGAYLLTHAIHRAGNLRARRVWLHTCSHDDPAALQLYQKHGFRIYHQEVIEKEFFNEK